MRRLSADYSALCFRYRQGCSDLSSASITLAGLAIVIFLGIAMVARDIHQRSVCMILSRPVSRPAYILGKYCGLGVTVLLAVLIIGILGVATAGLGIHFMITMDTPRNFSWGVMLLTLLYQYIALLVLMAFAFFYTVLTSNEYLSMLFTLCTYIIGNSLETIVKVLQSGEFFNAGTGYISVMKFLTWVFPNLSAFDLKIYLGYGIGLPWSNIIWTGVYGVFYIALLLFLTVVIFEKKELR
jgi:ABC-type transport system involved in multi-copper enzyme maturation permease subunit